MKRLTPNRRILIVLVLFGFGAFAERVQREKALNFGEEVLKAAFSDSKILGKRQFENEEVTQFYKNCSLNLQSVNVCWPDLELATNPEIQLPQHLTKDSFAFLDFKTSVPKGQSETPQLTVSPQGKLIAACRDGELAKFGYDTQIVKYAEDGKPVVNDIVFSKDLTDPSIRINTHPKPSLEQYVGVTLMLPMPKNLCDQDNLNQIESDIERLNLALTSESEIIEAAIQSPSRVLEFFLNPSNKVCDQRDLGRVTNFFWNERSRKFHPIEVGDNAENETFLGCVRSLKESLDAPKKTMSFTDAEMLEIAFGEESKGLSSAELIQMQLDRLAERQERVIAEAQRTETEDPLNSEFVKPCQFNQRYICEISSNGEEKPLNEEEVKHYLEVLGKNNTSIQRSVSQIGVLEKNILVLPNGLRINGRFVPLPPIYKYGQMKVQALIMDILDVNERVAYDYKKLYEYVSSDFEGRLKEKYPELSDQEYYFKNGELVIIDIPDNCVPYRDSETFENQSSIIRDIIKNHVNPQYELTTGQ